MRKTHFGNVILALALSSCGSIKRNSHDSSPEAPHASEAFLDFGIFTTSYISLVQSSSDQRLMSLGSIALTESTVGPIAFLPAESCAVASDTGLNLRDVALKSGAACAKGSLSLTGVDPNLSVRHSLDVDSEKLAADAVNWRQKLATQSSTATAVVTKRNQTLTVEQASDVALAVSRVTTADFRDTYTMARSGSGSPLVIVVTGSTIALQKLTMTESFSPANTILYFPEAISLRVTNSLLRGTIVAPLAAMSFSSSRLDGAVQAAAVSGDVKILWQPLTYKLTP